MTVLLHVSDTHFGTEQALVVEALVALSAAQRPDLLVLSGDITQRARRSQYRSARAGPSQNCLLTGRSPGRACAPWMPRHVPG